MTWLLLSLGAATLWACVTLTDKTFLGRYIPFPTLYLAISAAASLIPLVFLPLIVSIPAISARYIVLSGLVGILYVIYTYLYFQSLVRADASVVANLLLLVPILSTLLGTLLFNETFGAITYLGIVAVICGVGLTSGSGNIRVSRHGITISTAVGLMIASAILTAGDYALQKYLVAHITEVSVLYWSRVGIVLAAIVLFGSLPQLRMQLRSLLALGRWYVLPVSVGNELLDVVATFMTFVAYARGTLALVGTAISVIPVIVFAGTLIINYGVPGTIPSEEDRRLWKPRLAGLIVTIIGVYIISRAAHASA
jgi:drug/metabolite transporter (DMT)-like permease